MARLCSRGDVYLFIATPGQENIQPRIDGALDAIRDSGKPIRTHVVSSGVNVGHERKKIEATYLANRNLRGLFAVDAGSTAGVAEVMRKYRLHKRGVRAGGYDLLPVTLQAIHDRDLDFTIDQQPYLQGFLPVLQMFLYRYSDAPRRAGGHQHGPQFRHPRNGRPLPDDQSRFEGSSSPTGIQSDSGLLPPLNYSPRGVVFRRADPAPVWEWPWDDGRHIQEAPEALSKCMKEG